MLVDGAICERCRNWRYYNACLTRCMHGSLGMSALACVEAYVHKLLGSYTRAIDLFIAPSRSLRDRMIKHGVDPDKIVHLPYSILLDDYAPCYDSDGYGVCFGRLSPGKGLTTLVDACVAASEVPMKVLGDGPLASELVSRARSNGSGSVEFLGYKSGPELRSLVGRARFVVIPSECYENSPLALYESMALGKPVIGSRIGGIPELVDEGVTGLLFEPGNAQELSRCLRELWNDPARASDMGRAARARLEERFGPDQHYRRVMSIYERIAACG
jgi:glycosyltransferase involved in cell wall biosynthesis